MIAVYGKEGETGINQLVATGMAQTYGHLEAHRWREASVKEGVNAALAQVKARLLNSAKHDKMLAGRQVLH
jgi:hypothetical protein